MREPKFTESDRGFPMIEFMESRGLDCILQASSLIGDYPDPAPGSSYVWLGVYGQLMHLNRAQVDWLIRQLTAWRQTSAFDPTGEFKGEKE